MSELHAGEKSVGKYGYDRLLQRQLYELQKRRLDYKDRKLYGGGEGQQRISAVRTADTKH